MILYEEVKQGPVIEPCLTVHVMYSLTVYADSMLHHSLYFNEVDIKALIS
jgi:hypothetical protein